MKKLLCLLLASQTVFAQKDVIQPTSNLITKDIPDIPVSIKNDMQRYSESRAANFAAWHPLRKEMLISTRFGNVPQLHQVKFPMGDRKQISFFEDAVTDASYEPIHGDFFLFTKDIGGNEFGQIYRHDVKSGRVSLLTDGGRSQNGGMVWRHDGKMLVYGSTFRNGTDRDIWIMDPLNPDTKKILIQNQGGGWSVLDWSADGKKLLMMQYISANESHYWMADAATGIKNPLTDTTEKGVSYGPGRFSADGKGIYLTTDKENEFKRLAYMDLSAGKIKFISTMPWDVESFDLSQDGKTMVFCTNEEGSSAIYKLSVITGKYVKLSHLPAGVYSAPSIHNNGKDVALSINSAKSSSDIYVINLMTGKPVRWTESEMGGLLPDELSNPTLIAWRSFDDRTISGFYYPAAKKFTGKRPVIINIHGGPEGQSRPVFQGANNYMMNELGVAMIYPNVRGSSGFGKSFLAMDNGMNREMSVRDIGALFGWIARQPELDAGRVMVMGGSYGGYMSLAVSTHYADMIRCAIDVVGISNFNTFLRNTEGYRRDLRRVEYGDERNPAMYAFLDSISPLTNAGKISKPLFIVQGGNDPRVPRTEAEQMADKVKSNGGTVWYLEAKDEGHGFKKKSNADFQRWVTVMFIRKYLLN